LFHLVGLFLASIGSDFMVSFVYVCSIDKLFCERFVDDLGIGYCSACSRLVSPNREVIVNA
jgi:hypothetical protein